MILIGIEYLESVGRSLCNVSLSFIEPIMRGHVIQLGAHMRLGQLPCELRKELLYDAEVEQNKAHK